MFSALKKIEAVIQALPQAVAYFDEGDGYVLGNDAFAREMAGLGLEPSPGLPYLTILGQVAAIDSARSTLAGAPDWIADHLAARRQGPIAVDRDLADGRVLRVESNPTSLGGVVTLLSDITDLKRQTEELSAARDLAEAGNRAKGEFLANMSHELRTPMNGVIGVAELLAHENLTPKQAELVGLILASGSTLDKLLGDLLDMARVEAGVLEVADAPFDVVAALSAVIGQFASAAAENGVALEVDTPAPAPGWVLGDEVRLKQVLASLIANAVKFTSQGRIDVRIEVVDDALVFRVCDTGVGFDVAQKERLFRRFEQLDNSNTRRFGGAGLGLAVAMSLTVGMGGALVCDSTEGVGSIFILTIPYRRANAPRALDPAPLQPPASQETAPHILIVDDNPVNQRVLSLILEGAGVETELADDGLQAVTQWRTNHFDAILMDIQMPEMDGLTAVRSIRAIETVQGLNPTPIIMVSANAMPEHVAASFDAGANGHVAKPVTADRLFAALEDLASSKPPPHDQTARAV
jgi:signal transduction histidine kinase/CheY-like chemotaxis protein